MNHVCKAVAAAVIALGATGAQAVTDDFNRATLGPDWVMQAGSMATNGATVTGDPVSLMTYTPAAGQTSASIDVILSGDKSLAYGAIVLGFRNDKNNAFIKLQNNENPSNPVAGFDTLAFYYGNNNSFVGSFQNITGLESFTSVRMTGSLSGTVATLSIDDNFDGIADQTYSFDYGPGKHFGTGVGVGIYGNTQLDNFNVGAVPEPGTYALMLTGLAGVGVMARRRAKRG